MDKIRKVIVCRNNTERLGMLALFHKAGYTGCDTENIGMNMDNYPIWYPDPEAKSVIINHWW